MHTFDHTELCMGTVFRFAGNSALPPVETKQLIEQACAILHEADRIFSLYKPESPLSLLAAGKTNLAGCPPVVSEIWDACDQWEKTTNGFFSAMTPQNTFDPSGLVKTWAAQLAADVLLNAGVRDFTLNAGGDIFIADGVTDAVNWRIGISKTVSIASPEAGVLTVLDLKGTGFNSMATSGSAERGLHIWNPKAPGKESAQELLQVSVIAKDLVTADVWATAAFAEGIRAVSHLSEVPDIQALFIFADGQITGTPGVIELFAKPEL